MEKEIENVSAEQNFFDSTVNQEHDFEETLTANTPRKLPEHKPSFLRAMLLVFGIFFIATIFVGNIMFTPFMVVGMSMQPNLNKYVLSDSEFEENDTVYVANYGNFKHKDIVVFISATENKFFVKRIIGMPGDTISYIQKRTSLENGTIYLYYSIALNGTELAENYILEEMRIAIQDASTYSLYQAIVKQQTITLKQDEYFCLGDNRNNSLDSRLLGPIPRTDMLGKVYFVSHYGDGVLKGLIQSIFN